MKGLILCAGLGTRLLPITLTLPKHLIPIAGRPILFNLIDLFVKVNILEIGIVVSNNEVIFREALKQYENKEVKFKYIRQENPLGLANAVSVSRSFINDERFLMILGDNLYENAIENPIIKIISKSGNCQILIKEVEEPTRYGIVDIINKQIVDVVEKSCEPPTNLAMIGIYVFDKNIFTACQNIEPSYRGEYEITDSIKWLIDKGFKIEYEKIDCLWRDLGTPKDILDMSQYLLDNIGDEISGTLDKITRVTGNLKLGRDSKIINSTIRGPVTIGCNTVIQNCYIGPYTSIYDNVKTFSCEIENSIILDNCTISDIRDTISNSIIEKKCVIRGSKDQKRENRLLLGMNSRIEI